MQKISFGAAEGMSANQIIVGAEVKRERGADNFCLFREREWIVVKSGGLREADSLSKIKGRANNRLHPTWLVARFSSFSPAFQFTFSDGSHAAAAKRMNRTVSTP
ncbi:MAG: hypothetical protein GY832_20040 [Chloroflexi bacterium]|nr:hypothetical protein [Chloroflexota bacterium]